MARDETARDTDPEQSLLDRRSHLLLAGATAATLAEETVTSNSPENDLSSTARNENEVSCEVTNGSQ